MVVERQTETPSMEGHKDGRCFICSSSCTHVYHDLSDHFPTPPLDPRGVQRGRRVTTKFNRQPHIALIKLNFEVLLVFVGGLEEASTPWDEFAAVPEPNCLEGFLRVALESLT